MAMQNIIRLLMKKEEDVGIPMLDAIRQLYVQVHGIWWWITVWRKLAADLCQYKRRIHDLWDSEVCPRWERRRCSRFLDSLPMKAEHGFELASDRMSFNRAPPHGGFMCWHHIRTRPLSIFVLQDWILYVTLYLQQINEIIRTWKALCWCWTHPLQSDQNDTNTFDGLNLIVDLKHETLRRRWRKNLSSINNLRYAY